MPEKKYYLSFPSTHQLFYFAELLQKHKIKRNLIPALPGMAGSCSTLIEVGSGEIGRVKVLVAAENQSVVKIFSAIERTKLNLEWLEPYPLPATIKKSLYNLGKGKLLSGKEINYFIGNRNSHLQKMLISLADEIKTIWLGKKVEVWQLIGKTKNKLIFSQGGERVESFLYRINKNWPRFVKKENFCSVIIQRDWQFGKNSQLLIKDILSARKRAINLLVLELSNISFADLEYLLTIWRISLPHIFLAAPGALNSPEKIAELKKILSSGANMIILNSQTVKGSYLSLRQAVNVIHSVGKEAPGYLI